MLCGDLKWSEVAQSCPTLCDPVDCSLPSFSIHGILQARILEWVTISFSRGSSWPRDGIQVSLIGGRRFNLWKGNPRKRVLYVCVWLIHFGVQEKLTEHCKKKKNCNKKKKLSSEFHMAYILTFIRIFPDTIFFIKAPVTTVFGLPWWLSSKESTCSAGEAGDSGSIPGSGCSPGGGHGNPLHCSCLENPKDRGVWWATAHGVAKNQTWLGMSTAIFKMEDLFPFSVWLKLEKVSNSE